MKPRPIRWFEILLLVAIAIDLVNNLLLLPRMRGTTGTEVSAVWPILFILNALLPAALGLLFWYLVVRHRSNIARWVMALLVAAATIGFLILMAGAGPESRNPAMLVAAFSEMLKIAAVALLFHRDARGWFAAGPQAIRK